MVPTKCQKLIQDSKVTLVKTEKRRLEPLSSHVSSLLTVNKVICNPMKARGRENFDAKKLDTG